MMVHVCYPSNQQAEAGRFCELKANLDYITRSCFKNPDEVGRGYKSIYGVLARHVQSPEYNLHHINQAWESRPIIKSPLAILSSRLPWTTREPV